MNRQKITGVDGRASPALASSPHHSPRPRVARRGGAHAPPKGVLAGLASTHDCGAVSGRACSVWVARARVVRASFGVAETEGDQHTLRLPAGATPLASSGPLKPTPSATALEVCHGPERCCARIRRRVAMVRREDGREVPLHDTSCDLPPDQPMPVALHQGWPEGSLRPRGARSLDEEGGEVWLCGSAAAFGTSGK